MKKALCTIFGIFLLICITATHFKAELFMPNDHGEFRQTKFFKQKSTLKHQPQTPRNLYLQEKAANAHWARIYSGIDHYFIYDIQQTKDGGFIAAGMITDHQDWDQTDLLVVKFSPLGIIEWQKQYGGDLKEGYVMSKITQTDDGGYIVACESASYVGAQSLDGQSLWVLKLFPDGNIEWQNGFTYGHTFYPSGGIITLKDGGYIICGTTNTINSTEIVVLKISQNGSLEWAKSYGNSAYGKEGHQIVQTQDGGLAISLALSSQRIAGCLLKLDKNGNIEWQKQYMEGGRDRKYFSAMSTTSDGGFITCDYTDRHGASLFDFIVTKLNSSGDIIWQKLYGGPEYEWYSAAIKETRDGGYIFTGITKSYGIAGLQSSWLVNIDSEGNILWQKSFLPESQPFSTIQTEDGDFVVAGIIYASTIEMFFVKLSFHGEIGPCMLLESSDASVIDVIPVVKNAQLNSNFVSVLQKATFAVPRETDAVSYLYCWNLNQPPENVVVTQELNKSFLKTEYYNRISWNHNSWNDKFNVTHYRIYKDDGGSGYQLIAEVGGSIMEYLDGPVGNADSYYTIVSVADGMESPRSEPVK